jgi:N,N'-diacetyllegionaminate synthase
MSSVYIISELCGQWGGSVRKAEQMILQSKLAGADAVKVQLWDTYRMLGDNRELWEYLSMTKEQFLHLKEFANGLNIDFFASAFHHDRLEWLLEAGIKNNKIASSLFRIDFDLAKKMVEEYDFEKTFVSLGKWDEKMYPFGEKEGLIYLHCVSKYPHEQNEALKLMPETFEGSMLGYSDHSIGIDACVEAVKRGAKYIEKHFTIDHSLQCKTESAHVCSMNMEQLMELRNSCDKL